MSTTIDEATFGELEARIKDLKAQAPPLEIPATISDSGPASKTFTCSLQ